MASIPKKMGEDNIITNVGNSLICLFNTYQKNNFETFAEYITEGYSEEDIIKFLLTNYSNCLSTTAIKKILMNTSIVIVISVSIQSP